MIGPGMIFASGLFIGLLTGLAVCAVLIFKEDIDSRKVYWELAYLTPYEKPVTIQIKAETATEAIDIFRQSKDSEDCLVISVEEMRF